MTTTAVAYDNLLLVLLQRRSYLTYRIALLHEKYEYNLSSQQQYDEVIRLFW